MTRTFRWGFSRYVSGTLTVDSHVTSLVNRNGSDSRRGQAWQVPGWAAAPSFRLWLLRQPKPLRQRSHPLPHLLLLPLCRCCSRRNRSQSRSPKRGRRSRQLFPNGPLPPARARMRHRRESSRPRPRRRVLPLACCQGRLLRVKIAAPAVASCCPCSPRACCDSLCWSVR